MPFSEEPRRIWNSAEGRILLTIFAAEVSVLLAAALAFKFLVLG